MALHISRDGAEIGQWTEEEVRGFYREGSLVATDHYWMEGMAEWQSLGSLMEPPPVAAPAPIQAELPPASETAPASEKPKPLPAKPSSWVTATASGVGAVVGFGIAQQFSGYAKYGLIGAAIGVVLGLAIYAIGQFALKTTKLRHAIWIGALLGLLAGVALSPWLVGQEFDDALVQASAIVNQKCPMMVDSITRLDGSSVDPGRKFIYRYTILGDQTLKADDIQTKLRPILIKSWEANPSINLYRQMGVTLEYQYFTEDKHPLATITFNANDVPQ